MTTMDRSHDAIEWSVRPSIGRSQLRCVKRICAVAAITTLCFMLNPCKDCFAQDGSLTGVWKYELDKEKETDRLAAIDEATEEMVFLMRGQARELLREKTQPHPSLSLSDEGNRVTIQIQKQRAAFKTDGSPVQVKQDEETATIRAKREDGKLIVETRGKKGVQTVEYELSVDRKQLFLETTIMVSKIGKPVKYKTVYIRTEP